MWCLYRAFECWAQFPWVFCRHHTFMWLILQPSFFVPAGLTILLPSAIFCTREMLINSQLIFFFICCILAWLFHTTEMSTILLWPRHLWSTKTVLLPLEPTHLLCKHLYIAPIALFLPRTLCCSLMFMVVGMVAGQGIPLMGSESCNESGSENSQIFACFCMSY